MESSSRPGRSIWLTFFISLVAVVAALGVLVRTTGGWSFWIPLPENVSEHGQSIDDLFYICTWITVITFVLVQAALMAYLFHYRYDPNKRGIYTHGHHRLEVIWTVTPTVILLIVVGMSIKVWADVRVSQPENPDVIVDVLGQQFQWNFRYAGPDGKFGRTDPALYDPRSNVFGLDPDDANGKDDITSVGTMHIPKGKDVVVRLRSKDVLHSFFLPNFRLKMDTVPGMTGSLHFKATKAGKYEVICAELCGAQHWSMRAMLEVHETMEAYEAVLEQMGS